ncbi:response regulator, partial [Desulfobulbus sp. N3]|nr:response regulator [Desulfobulbus sp. N3]
MKKVKDNTSGEILIVDDVPENLQLLVSFLTAQGYQVRPASDGELALAAVKKRLPDLILLDIKMPDMDGFEVCRRLKADERTCNIPVIFISALSSLEDRLKGFAVGGLDYIIKPFEEVEVLARVKNHLQLYRMQEHLEDVVNERTQELKESEQQLQRARKMEAIGRLAGGIAHDFNNILSAILGFAELIIITKSSDSEVTEYAQQVITATNRAAHLVKQILSYSNKSNVTKELFQPHFVVEEAMKLLRTTLPKTLTIVEDIDPDFGSILANPMNIHQVVVNL